MTAREEILMAAAHLAGRSVDGTFTVGDVIEFLRARGTRYSISTITTHVTSRMSSNAPDNHAVVHDDLIRVSRGRYRLRQERPAAEGVGSSSETLRHLLRRNAEHSQPRKGQRPRTSDAPTLKPMQLLGHAFTQAGRIDAERDAAGAVVIAEPPHLRYQNGRELPLNKYGLGPFSKRLTIPRLPDEPGVYALADDDDGDATPLYIGRARDSLRRGWGPMGYQAIQPRNCFVGGQPTNCRIKRS